MTGTFHVANIHQNGLIGKSLYYAWVAVFEIFINKLKKQSFLKPQFSKLDIHLMSCLGKKYFEITIFLLFLHV